MEPTQAGALLKQKQTLLRLGTASRCTVAACSGWLLQVQRRPSRAMSPDSGCHHVIFASPSSGPQYGLEPLRHPMEHCRSGYDCLHCHGGSGGRLLWSARLLLCTRSAIVPSFRWLARWRALWTLSPILDAFGVHKTIWD